jgi:hypothetical protein
MAEKYAMGHFAIFEILIILLDFIPLTLGLAVSTGSFQSKFIKMAIPIWLTMIVLGSF